MGEHQRRSSCAGLSGAHQLVLTSAERAGVEVEPFSQPAAGLQPAAGEDHPHVHGAPSGESPRVFEEVTQRDLFIPQRRQEAPCRHPVLRNTLSNQLTDHRRGAGHLGGERPLFGPL